MKTVVSGIIGFFLLLIPFVIDTPVKAQNPTFPNLPKFLKTESNWADSVFLTLTPKERIAQLFMVAAYSVKGKEEKEKIEALIKTHKIGGLIFMQGIPEAQIDLINNYQSLSKVPLLIGLDAERGLAFRLQKTVLFPAQMTLGAIENEDLIFELGKEIGRQCKRVGVHVNFAPVADINNNIQNPVIKDRSFGEDKRNVARKANAMMRGMQGEGIIAVGKHFPGHGDTHIDSHYGLPLIQHPFARLDSIELFPFKDLIQSGIGGIMTAHLNIPALDSVQQIATLSPLVVNKLLKKELGFNGLVFTDALNMQGVTNHYKNGNAELKALLAGNDILLFSTNVKTAIEKIDRAVREGIISQSEIDRRVKKILKAKEWVGLNHFKPISKKNIWYDLNNRNAELLEFNIARNAICVAKNKNSFLPLKRLDSLTILSVGIGTAKRNNFQKMLGKYAALRYQNISKSATNAEFEKILEIIKNYNTVIINIHNNEKKGEFGITNALKDFLNKIPENKKVILDYFGIPYGLTKFENLDKVHSIIVSYEDNPVYHKVSAQTIFGGMAAKGMLSVSGGKNLKAGTAFKYDAVRLGYSDPDLVRMQPDTLKKIDRIVENAVANKAMPGCRVLVARKGKIIFNKAYGHHTYKKKRRVKKDDIYDLASVTKIVSAVPSIMKLYDKKKIGLNDNIATHLSFLRFSDKSSLTIKELLAHQSGFKPWIPFYYKFIDTLSYEGKLIKPRKKTPYTIQVGKKAYLNADFRFKKDVFSTRKTGLYTNEVGENLYMNRNYVDTIYEIIKESELFSKKYRYSDLGLILMKPVIEKIGKQKLEQYVDKNFYKRLGATTTTYLPLKKFPKHRIVPTAKDPIIRKKMLYGYVHDPNTSLLGGVSGHAGLFSNAEDIAKLLQMYLNGGTYGGERFLTEETLKLFTSRAFPEGKNRRGIGFDKPQIDTTLASTPSRMASRTSYGHGGFTGNLVWVDPEYDLIYIFLSNRVYPNDWNDKLIKMEVRGRIHDVIYSAMTDRIIPLPYFFNHLVFFPVRWKDSPDKLETIRFAF